MQKARSSGYIQDNGEDYTFYQPTIQTAQKYDGRLNLDLAPALSSATPKEQQRKQQLLADEDKDAKFVEFLKNI